MKENLKRTTAVAVNRILLRYIGLKLEMYQDFGIGDEEVIPRTS